MEKNQDYTLLAPLPEDRYKKIKIKHNKCGHEDYLCIVGMERRVKCKICHKKVKKAKRNKEILPKLPTEYWGTIYYVKAKNSNFYKIGISSRTVNERFENEEQVSYLWEFPCYSLGEAKSIEQFILFMFNDKKVINNKILDAPLIIENGKGEWFIEDVLINFDMNLFIYKVLEMSIYMKKRQKILS